MKQLMAIAAALLACGVAPVSAQDDVLVKLYTEARQAEAAGDYKTATARYERIVSLRPSMAEAHANLGNLYYVQGLHEQASASFKKAVRLKPSLAAPRFFLGMLSFNARDFGPAISSLKEAERLDPANLLAPLYIGYTYYVQDRYQDAAAVLERVAAADPKNADALYQLSKTYGQISKHYFEKLQTSQPDSFYTALARSHFYESGASWEQAAQELAKAVAAKPANDELKQRLAWLKQRSSGATEPPQPGGAFSGSTEFLYAPPEGVKIRDAWAAEKQKAASAAGQSPDSPESLYKLADAYQALSFLSSLWLLDTDPDSYRSHELRGEALEAAGKIDEAVAEYRRALEIKPELQTVHFTIGNMYWLRGRMDEAAAELREELKVNPNDPQAHYELADILFSQNNSDEAEKHYLHALKYSPNLPEAHLAMERIASARGDSAAAIIHLKKAAEISPESSAAHYRLWLLYRKLGRTAEAQQERELFQKLKALERK